MLCRRLSELSAEFALAGNQNPLKCVYLDVGVSYETKLISLKQSEKSLYGYQSQTISLDKTRQELCAYQILAHYFIFGMLCDEQVGRLRWTLAKYIFYNLSLLAMKEYK